MHFHLFHQPTKHLLSPAEIYDVLFREDRFLENGLVFRCFLPRAYWERRGMIVLFEHPAVGYERLPETQEAIKLPVVNTKELRNAFHPVKVATALSQKDERDLAFYMEYAFGLKWDGHGHPFDGPDLLLEAIRRKFKALNHAKKADIQTRFILPVRNLFLGMKRFPVKKNLVIENFFQKQTKFFNNFEVLQLHFLLSHLNDMKREKTGEVSAWLELYNRLEKCRSVRPLLYKDNNEMWEATVIAGKFLSCLDELYQQVSILK